MRLLGIVFGLAAVACGGATAAPAAPPTAPPATPTPSPSGVPAWVEELTFAGDVTGLLNQAVAPDAITRSECTGRNSQGSGLWSSIVYGPVGRAVYGVTAVVDQYRGPGTYTQPQAAITVHRFGDNTVAWQSVADDPVQFVVSRGEESGTVTATLNNTTTGKPTLKISGKWSCRT